MKTWPFPKWPHDPTPVKEVPARRDYPDDMPDAPFVSGGVR